MRAKIIKALLRRAKKSKSKDLAAVRKVENDWAVGSIELKGEDALASKEMDRYARSARRKMKKMLKREGIK